MQNVTFQKNRFGQMCYSEKGFIKTYANMKQAVNKMDKLKAQGIEVYTSLRYPFVLVKEVK